MIECYLDRAMMSEHKVLQLSISRLSHFATTFFKWIYICKYQYIYIYVYFYILGEHRPASYATTARTNGDQAESASTEYFSVEPLCHIFWGIYTLYIYKHVCVCVSISEYTHLSLHSSMYIHIGVYIYIYMTEFGLCI